MTSNRRVDAAAVGVSIRHRPAVCSEPCECLRKIDERRVLLGPAAAVAAGSHGRGHASDASRPIGLPDELTRRAHRHGRARGQRWRANSSRRSSAARARSVARPRCSTCPSPRWLRGFACTASAARGRRELLLVGAHAIGGEHRPGGRSGRIDDRRFWLSESGLYRTQHFGWRCERH